MFHKSCNNIPYHASLILLREIIGLERAAMLGHSHSTTNKILSTFSSTTSTCSSDHHNLGKGSCTGVFFQLFDWNGRLHKKQRLRRKSLPAERPASPVLRDRNGECTKVPADQNLKISDPCYYRDMDGHGNSPSQRERTPPEKKKVKRGPNVVAKLMGLETMPSPDFRREKWPDARAYQHQSPLRIHNHEERSFSSHSRIPSSRRNLLEMGNGKIDVSTSMSACRPPCLSQGLSSMRHHEDANCDALVLKMSAKSSPPSALTMQDCKFRTILSPSNTHNKLSAPVKSPLASKARVCLFEAANKILEPSKQPRVAANESADGNNENENKSTIKNENKSTIKRELNLKQSCSSSASSCPASKLSTGGYCGSTTSLHAARPKESYSAMAIYNEGVTTEGQFYRGSGIHENVDSSKCHQIQQGSKYGKEDKRKLCLRRQDKSCRQQNECAGAKVKNVPPSKVENRGPSYHKIRGKLPEQQGEVQGTSSSTSSMSSVITQSSTKTSIVKNREILSSHSARTDQKNMEVSSRGTPKTESSTKRGSLSKRGAGTTSSQERIFKSRSATTASTSSGNRSVSQRSHSVEESVCTDQLDLECKYGNPAESLSFNSRNSNDVVDVNSLYQEDCLLSTSIEIISDDLNKKNYARDSRVGKSGLRGNCTSSVEEMSDTTTSCIADGLHKRKQTVSYSGKSTATILHELLSALNQPARPLVAENNANPELSDITNGTTQAREWSSMEEHTKEDCSYSCISEEECFGYISKTEDLSLRFSREDEQQTSHHLGRKIQSSYFEPKSKQKGALTFSWAIVNQKPTYELTKYVVQTEEDYVKFIVDNLNSAQCEWSLSGNNFLVDPALYGDLEMTATHHWVSEGMRVIDSENWSILNPEGYENLARNHRKLVFDCVGEALNLDVGISQQPPQWSSTPNFEYLQSKTCCQRVIKHLNSWRGERCGMNVDDLVEKAMNTGSGKWEDFSDEISGIPEQVDQMVIDDLIDELLLDLRSSQQTSVNVRGVNKMLETNERKALIWVGL